MPGEGIGFKPSSEGSEPFGTRAGVWGGFGLQRLQEISN